MVWRRIRQFTDRIRPEHWSWMKENVKVSTCLICSCNSPESCGPQIFVQAGCAITVVQTYVGELTMVVVALSNLSPLAVTVSALGHRCFQRSIAPAMSSHLKE